MEVAPENGKELSHSAHAKGKNELIIDLTLKNQLMKPIKC